MPSAEELRHFPLFAALSPQQCETVAAHAQTITLPAGRRLFEQGEAADRCWLIRSGRVTLDVEVLGAGRQVVQTLGAGDVLGWSWLVPPYRWQLGAETTEPVVAELLDGTALRAVADRDPSCGYPLALGLIAALLPRLQSTRARLLNLYGSPRDR
jgi:CRP/FNR family transcriptional regulator, cyclic AMP receptor protein